MDGRIYGYGKSVPGALSLAHVLVLSPCVYVYVLICLDARERVCVCTCIRVYICTPIKYILWFFFLLSKYIYKHTFGLVMRQTTKKRYHTLCEHLYGKRLRNLILPKHSSFILILNADLLGSSVWTWLMLLLLRDVTNLTTDRTTDSMNEQRKDGKTKLADEKKEIAAENHRRKSQMKIF